jgi:hypothetical protein
MWESGLRTRLMFVDLYLIMHSDDMRRMQDFTCVFIEIFVYVSNAGWIWERIG